MNKEPPIARVASFMSMLLAGYELDSESAGESMDMDAVAMSFMGSGASDALTYGEIKAFVEAVNKTKVYPNEFARDLGYPNPVLYCLRSRLRAPVQTVAILAECWWRHMRSPSSFFWDMLSLDSPASDVLGLNYDVW